mgnify:CR=1 FL=1|jgi:hypothetical protein
MCKLHVLYTPHVHILYYIPLCTMYIESILDLYLKGK